MSGDFDQEYSDFNFDGDLDDSISSDDNISIISLSELSDGVMSGTVGNKNILILPKDPMGFVSQFLQNPPANTTFAYVGFVFMDDLTQPEMVALLDTQLNVLYYEGQDLSNLITNFS